MNKNTILCISLLLLSLMISVKSNIPTVKSFPDIHQGDLILSGNNVTIIEGRFDLNGSIIIEENATLILRNAILNFTQSHSYQFYMNIQNPLQGNPKLLIENATITTDYTLYVQSYENSSIIGDKLSSAPEIRFFTHDDSFISLTNSSLYDLHAFTSSFVTISDSFFTWLVSEHDSNMMVVNSTIEYLRVGDNSNFTAKDCFISYDIIPEFSSVNCTINELQSGFVNYWNLVMNSSAIIAPTGWAPNITLLNTEVASWSFLLWGTSNATISNCNLRRFGIYDSAVAHVYNSTNNGFVEGKYNSKCYLYGTTIGDFTMHDNAILWLENTTYTDPNFHGSGKAYVSWYLNTHVIDQIGQDVPSANITIIHPNTTLADSKLADAKGQSKFTLMEKMMNTTGEYPVGNYTIEATYSIHSDSTTVNITENKQIELTLEDFVIPEHPSLIILPLLIIATSLLTLLYRKREKSIKL